MNHLESLRHAIAEGNLAAVESILAEHNDLIHARGEDGGTALHFAAWHGKRTIAELLAKRGADLNCRDTVFGATPAGWAIEHLRELGGYLAIELDDMAYAIEQGDVRWVQRFLARFPHLRDATHKDGLTFYELAQRSGNPRLQAIFDHLNDTGG